MGTAALTIGTASFGATVYVLVFAVRQGEAKSAWFALHSGIDVIEHLMLPLFGLMLLLRSRFAWHFATGHFIVNLIVPLIAAVAFPLLSHRVSQRPAAGTLGTLLVLTQYVQSIATGLVYLLVLMLLTHPPVRALIERFARGDAEAETPLLRNEPVQSPP